MTITSWLGCLLLVARAVCLTLLLSEGMLHSQGTSSRDTAGVRRSMECMACARASGGDERRRHLPSCASVHHIMIDCCAHLGCFGSASPFLRQRMSGPTCVAGRALRDVRCGGTRLWCWRRQESRDTWFGLKGGLFRKGVCFMVSCPS